jgi:hypothetical protein
MQSKLRLLALGTLAALSTALSVQAQCYEPNTGASVGVGDDIVLPIQALGFAFPFNGTTYTHIHPTTNGFVYLSNNGVPAPAQGALCCTGTTAALVAGSPKIAPYWSDLNVVSGTGTTNFNALPGKAVVTWTNAVEFGNTVQFSVQLQLLASGEILFAYDGRCAIRTAGDFLVGMSEANGAAVPAASDFSTVGTSASATAFQLFNNAGLTYDLAGQTVQFVPNGLGYTWIPSQCASSNVSYGSGCYNIPAVGPYEFHADAAIASADLQGNSIFWVPVGSGYQGIWNAAPAYIAPTAGATSLAASDDGNVTVTVPGAGFPSASGPVTQFNISSNGIIAFGAVAPNGADYTPTGAEFAAATVGPAFYCWHDYNPQEAGSGAIKTELVGNVFCITWDAVENYSTPLAVNTSTIQFQFDLATGTAALRCVTIDSNISSAFGSATLVGWKGAGSVPDAGSIDLAVGAPTSNPNFLLPLALAASPAPTPGATLTFTTSNMPEFVPTSGLYVGLHILSLNQFPAPGLDLAVLQAPGCSALIQTIDFAQTMVGATNSQSVTFALPATLPLGFQLFSQSAALFTPGTLPNGQNPGGLSTSNGVASLIGAW